jgi:hypothetical protein
MAVDHHQDLQGPLDHGMSFAKSRVLRAGEL